MNIISHFPPCLLPLVTLLFLFRGSISSPLLRLLAPLALLALLSVLHENICQTNLLPFHDVADVSSSTALLSPLPFLPPPGDPAREQVRIDLLNMLQKKKKKSSTNAQNHPPPPQRPSSSSSSPPGHALITGASRGIGRAITIELARRYPSLPLYLTARNMTDLKRLASDLHIYYNVTNITLAQSDFSKVGEAERLYRANAHNGIYVDVLVLNAGIGLTGPHVSFESKEVERLLRINIESAAVLAGRYGREMQIRSKPYRTKSTTSSLDDDGKAMLPELVSGGRIMFVGSIAGTVPCVPNSVAYAASKAFLRSFATGLSSELEAFGIAVTSALPGATVTSFASASNMGDAFIWNFPPAVSKVQNVAKRMVDGMVRGDSEVMPGRVLDVVLPKVVVPLVPTRFISWFVGFCWKPWPFRYPGGWNKSSMAGGTTSADDADGTRDKKGTCESEYETEIHGESMDGDESKLPFLPRIIVLDEE